MFRKILRLEFKSFFRSSQFGAGIAMKILMYLSFFNLGLLFFGGAFGLYFYAKEEGEEPLVFFCRFFLLYWLVDLSLKYFIQQLPTNNIKPLLTLNVTKNKITTYIFLKILSSFFSWAFLLFIIPFTVLLIGSGNYSTVSILCLMGSVFFFILFNAFLNTLLNKNSVILYSLAALFLGCGLLHYFKVVDFLKISENFFMLFYQNKWMVILPLLLAFGFGYATFLFIKNNLYLDKGLEMKKTVGKTENIDFLNQYGAIGTFINNDIKLIRRSKAARSALIGGFLFLFYGLLVFNSGYKFSFMQIFLGIFVTGGFNMMFGQKVPAWDSSYYPLMMTQNIPYKDYLKAKWWMFVVVTLLSMVLAVFYGIFYSWEFYFTILAAGLYNLGVNSYLTLLAGAYNKKPIDLNTTSKGFAGGENNFNIKMLLIVLPQMALPMMVFGVTKFFLGMIPAIISLAVLGLIGFFLRDKIFDMIVKLYKKEKYSTIASFKNV